MKLSARTVAVLGAVALALGNLGRIPAGAFGGRSAPVVLIDLTVALVWLVLVMAVASRATPIAIDRVMAAVATFVVVALVSSVLAFGRYHLGFTEGAGVLAFLARWIAYFGWYPFVAWCLSPSESRAAWRDIERALLVIAVFGIFQTAFLPGFAQMLYRGDMPVWDVQGRRLVSTLLDPNFAGILIVIALLFRLARIAEDDRDSGVAMTVLGVGMLLTLSRSSILAFAVGVVVLAAVRGLRLRLFRLLLLAALLIFPFVTILLSFAAGFHKLTYDASAAQRLVPWTRAIQLVTEHPWLGVGFNAIKQAQAAHDWHPIGGADVSFDGGLLFVAAMTGLVGLFFYLAILQRVWSAARRAWRDRSLAPSDRAHATATVAATAAVVVHSLFVNSLLLPFVMQVLWVMWGRLAQISAERRRAGRLAKAAGVAVAVVGLAGCDPCAGTIGCTSSPRVALTGAIVDHTTGAPVPGTRVDVQLTSPGGFSASASAMTNAEGVWQIRLDAAAADSIQAQATIAAPGRIAYVTPAFPVRSSTMGGEANAVGQWSDVPYVHYLGTVVQGTTPIFGALAYYAPIADPTLTITVAQLADTTNDRGVFEIDFVGTRVATLRGTLTLTGGNLSRSIVVQGYSIPLDYHFGIPVPHAPMNVDTVGTSKDLTTTNTPPT